MKSLPLLEWSTLEEAVYYLSEKLQERWTPGHVLDAGKKGLFLVQAAYSVRSPGPIRGIVHQRTVYKVNGKELEAYVAMRLAEAPKLAADPVIHKTGAVSPPSPLKINKLRRNILDPAIDKAIALAGNTELADVYLQLRDLAIEEEKPFNGIIEGDALCYTNDNGEPARLTKDALGKRLKSRAK